MLLRYIDDLALSGVGQRTEDEHASVSVSLAELQSLQNDGTPRAQWVESEEIEIPRFALFYDDTDDGSNAYIKSWQDFYRKGASLGSEESPVWGGNTIMRQGATVPGSVLKAGIYLRFSRGFRDWLATKDSSAAENLSGNVEQFEALVENTKTKKLRANWTTKLQPTNAWLLPIIARCSDGRAIVLGLNPDATEKAILEDADEVADTVDLSASRELASLLRRPESKLVDIIDGELHAQTGMGRNAFGANTVVNHSEYGRLLGPVLRSETTQTRRTWERIKALQYRVAVSPTPDSSTLLFFPEGDLSFETVAQVIGWEQDKRRIQREAWEQQHNPTIVSSQMDQQPVIGERSNFVPTVDSVTVVITGVLGGQKRKRTVLGVYPSVMLYYWEFLNHELLRQSLDWRVNNFARAAITGQEAGRISTDPPSVYGLWTQVFTQALQLAWISARPFWNYFQRYAKSYSGVDLIDNRRALNYFDIIAGLRRLQHLIGTFREQLAPDEASLREELRRVEAGLHLHYGVIEMSNTETPANAREFLGEWYDVLGEGQRRKIDEFVRRSWQGVPTDEYPAFVRGALVGMLLSELRWRVTDKAGRRFEATQGRHPSAMRGEIIPSVFSRGVGLLENTDQAGMFNSKVLPFVVSCVPESRTNAFNNGFIMGLAYIPSSKNTTEERNDAGAE